MNLTVIIKAVPLLSPVQAGSGSELQLPCLTVANLPEAWRLWSWWGGTGPGCGRSPWASLSRWLTSATNPSCCTRWRRWSRYRGDTQEDLTYLPICRFVFLKFPVFSESNLSPCICVCVGRGGPCGSGGELHVRAAGERNESPGGESTCNKHWHTITPVKHANISNTIRMF